MTLDEAIKHAEEVANREAENAEWFDLGDDSSEMFREKYERCRECAEEHRQLAEWLKNYKRLLEQTEPERKIGHCKECKYFEYNSVAKINGMSLIVAHEICKRWGDGCKTREDGYCFLYEAQESEEV